MSADPATDRLATLVALFAPNGAAELMGFIDAAESPGAAGRAAELLRQPRSQRLAALRAAWPEANLAWRRSRAAALAARERERLATALRRVAAGAPPPGGTAFVRLLDELLALPPDGPGVERDRSPAQASEGQPCLAAESAASFGPAAARPVNSPPGVSPLFPFPLPQVSAGFAALSPAARELGRRSAGLAAAALATQVGGPVEIAGEPLPGPCPPGVGVVRLGLSLAAISAHAVLEVESTLAAQLADRLAGGSGDVPAALELTPVERGTLDLLALVALSGAAADPALAAQLAPRLTLRVEDPRAPLTVDLRVRAGAARGRCRLHLPESALRALAGRSELPPAVAAWRLEGLLSSGHTSLDWAELSALRPGDRVLLDEPPGARSWIRLPGVTLRGRAEEDLFTCQEIDVNELQAQVPAVLTVEIARVTLTLGELARVEPGAAFPLHVPRDGRVLLRLGERAVARGQLVDIDGALGVRIEGLEVAP